jgi:hypothetical protein
MSEGRVIMQYNGHKNYNYWNVSLWLFNDEGLYGLVRDSLKKGNKDLAAKMLLEVLPEKTPDGVKYNFSNVRAALTD